MYAVCPLKKFSALVNGPQIIILCQAHLACLNWTAGGLERFKGA